MGIDFCRRTNLTIKFGKEDDFNWLSTNYVNEANQFSIRANNDYIILPNTVHRIKFRVPDDPKMDLGYFVPAPRIKDQLGLILDDALLEPNSNNSILIFNPNIYDIQIPKGLKLGYVTPVIAVDVIHENMFQGLEKEDPSPKNETPEFILGTNDPQQIEPLLELLQREKDLFVENVSQIRTAVDVEHEIKLFDDTPIKQKPYPTSATERELIRQQVREMLANDFIQESQSPFSSPVVMIKKKDGTQRFCIDYRKLNAVTIKDNHPLPRIDNVLEQLAGSIYFSTLDLQSAYWNIPVKIEDRFKTAFVTFDGLYEFKVMAFGLSNAPSTFQRYIQKVLSDLLHRCAMAFLDDIVIFSKTFEEHLEHLKLVLNRIRQYNLRLNRKKCKFLCEEIDYLGHKVNKQGIMPNTDKVRAVTEFPVPRKIKDVQSFLGLTGYYRPFIERYAFIAEPLTTLLRKNTKFQWDKKCETAFQTLKKKLINAPILAHYKPECETEIYTDSSGIGMACILGQIQDEKHVVLSYNSKLFSPAEHRYSTVEQEALAIVYAVKKYRNFIHGKHFTVITDNCALCYLMRMKNTNMRIVRWALMLQCFDFTVKHRGGKRHLNVDCLSRYPINDDVGALDEFPLYLNETIDVKAEQSRDDWCKEMTNQINLGQTRTTKKFIISEGILYRKSFDEFGKMILLVCVPKKLRRQILESLHSSDMGGAHLGFLKTLIKVKSRFTWPHLESSVKRFVENCESCQLVKSSNQPKTGLLQPIISGSPFKTCGLDSFGPLTPSKKGHRYVVLLIDLHSKYMEAKPLRNVKAPAIADWIANEVIMRHGLIENILTDNGKNFCSKLMEGVFKVTGSNHLKTTPYHPQSNGEVEKAVHTVKTMITHYVRSNLTNWHEFLPKVVFSYNISFHKVIKFSPFQVIFGRQARLPIDFQYKLNDTLRFCGNYREQFDELNELIEMRIKDEKNNQKLNYDYERRDDEFEIGDLVSLRTPRREVGLSTAFLTQRTGPYRITRKWSPLVYSIQHLGAPKTIKKVNISRLNKWNSGKIEQLDESAQSDEPNLKESNNTEVDKPDPEVIKDKPQSKDSIKIEIVKSNPEVTLKKNLNRIKSDLKTLIEPDNDDNDDKDDSDDSKDQD